jgi:hypothetical protein
MHKSRQLHLRLQTESAPTLGAESERELIETLAELILAVAKANDRSNNVENGGFDEREDQ